MRKILVSAAAFAGLGAVAGFGAPAFASDLPSNKAPPAPVFTQAPIAFSWTGFYGGIEGGADFARDHGQFNVNGGAATPYNVNRTGGQLGGLVGYNQQIGSLVLGVEGNFDGLIGGKRTSMATDALGNHYNITGSSTYDADVRGRVGYAIDRALLFAAGGVAFGNIDTGLAGANLPGVTTFNAQRVGWTLGGGVDYAFTNNIVGRAEYRFTDLGSATFTNVPAGVSEKMRGQSNAALLGIMYKFGAP